MMTLILIMIVVAIGLFMLLAAGTIFLQNYFNESPPPPAEVFWRAGVGGAVLGIFYGYWILAASGNPDRFAALTDFSATAQSNYIPKMKIVIDKKSIEVTRFYDERGRIIYKINPNTLMPTTRPEAVIIEEDGQEVTFNPDRGPDGKFHSEAGLPLKYRDSKGRIMEDGFLGQITTRRAGWAFWYFVLNVFHFGLWFAVGWPLMRFSIGQSIVIALVAWVVATLFVLPPIITQARKVHKEKMANTPARNEVGKQKQEGGR